MIWGTPILGNQRPLSEEHSSAIAFPSNLRATAEYFFRGFGIGHSGTKHPSCIKLPSAFLGTSRSGSILSGKSQILRPSYKNV